MSKRRRCHQCKKLFFPEHDTKTVTQKLCCCRCAAAWYATQKGSRRLAKLTCKQVGRRSMAEVKFDALYIEGKKSVNADYEADMFTYSVDEVRKYTPDWTLYTSRGRTIYIEFKGVLDGATRKKMKLIKKQYPKLDIRIVFECAKNKINKLSKTTYGMWADQWGFQWADNELPKDWLK